MRFTLLLSMFSLLASCGFREGWGEDEKVRSNKTAEQFCEDKEGHSWVDGTCQEDSYLLDGGRLNETQCNNVKDAYWVEDKCTHYAKLAEDSCNSFPDLTWHGEVCAVKAKVECESEGKIYDEDKCVDRPTVKFTGALNQSLGRSGQLEPIAYEVSQGAVLSIKNTTCDGFFALKDGKVVSNADYKMEEGTSSCSATLVALQRTIESESYTVTADFSSGFLSYCTDPNVEKDIFWITNKLLKRVGTVDCNLAAELLSKEAAIEFIGDRRISRLEPFSGLNNLRQLEIRGHSITSVPASIAKLNSLWWLDLSHGSISDISALAESKTIKSLILDGNPIANPANRTEKNCPTKAGTNEEVKAYCLSTL